MRHDFSYQKPLTLLFCCIFILITSIQPADAGKGNRTFAITMLVSGLGLQVGSTFLNASAENRYEDYLSAVIQSDIQSQKSDVVTFKNASVSMSRVGYGFIGLAVIISILDQISESSIDTESIPQQDMNTLSGRIGQNTFSSSNPSYLMSHLNASFQYSKGVGLYPSYDIQEQRTNLQFTFRF
ncbi:hypothetical protein F4X73_00625 [Candidatus Poribacteria bacterium]|nr:hypothetical protein [Candidatus Poribacteria bacterium]